MPEYTYKAKPEKSSKAYGENLRISTKDSVEVCKAIRGKLLRKGRLLLEDLINKKTDLNGKHYTKAAKEIKRLLEEAESNAEYKGLNSDRLFIHASAHKGFRMYTPRRFKLRRRQRKTTNVQIVLEER